jgi:hypothetical protein
MRSYLELTGKEAVGAEELMEAVRFNTRSYTGEDAQKLLSH